MKAAPRVGEQPGGRPYHHGDLANALLSAATELAREGGPQAVVLREAARRVGVSATAAYRHFKSQVDLVWAVHFQALDVLLATTLEELESEEPLDDPLAEVARQLRAMGRGYLRFALTEPGLFRVAFNAVNPVCGDESVDKVSDTVFQMLQETLKKIGECGGREDVVRLPRLDATIWAVVHGLATLLLDGPLASLTEEERRQVIETSLDFVLVAVTGRPPEKTEPSEAN